MPYTKADRIIRERQKQAEAQERKDQAEVERQARTRSQSNLIEIKAEIPIVLRLLAEHNYPFMREILVPDRWLGLIRRRVLKATWEIGSCQFPDGGWEGSWTTQPVYLLSDGRLFVYHGLYSPRIAQRDC